MVDKFDIRFKILNHLARKGSSTEEVQCSDFLACLHPDLGTIRRTLKELIVKGYINESNIDWAKEREQSTIWKIETIGSPQKKESSRLLDRQDIKEIKLYLTLDGKKFLIEAANLKHTTRKIRNEWWMKFAILIIGGALTLSFQGISKAIFHEGKKPSLHKDSLHSRPIMTLVRSDNSLIR